MESQEQSKGPELIFTKAGNPFQTEESAKSAITKLGLNPAEHAIVRSGDGFGIINVIPSSQKQISKPEEPQETYKHVIFSAKSNPNDTDDVHLSVNGNALIIQREQDVILPSSYLECADHARYPQFRQLPGKPRKIIAWIKTYPYTPLGDATREEFESQRSIGTKKLKQDIEKYGYDVNPETMPDV